MDGEGVNAGKTEKVVNRRMKKVVVVTHRLRRNLLSGGERGVENENCLKCFWQS